MERKPIYRLVLFSLIYLGFTLNVPSLVHAETLPLKQYITSDGLAHDRVNRIVRDSRDFLWSFITAEEYQRRFSSIVTHTNAECSP